MSTLRHDIQSLRLEAQACQTETDPILRLQRQIQLVSALDAACVGLEFNRAPDVSIDPRKIQLLKEQLKITPPRVDATTPGALRTLAGRMEGAVWTDEFVTIAEAEFKRLTLEASEVNDRAQRNREAALQLKGSLTLYETYANLLNTLTGQGQEEIR